MSLAAEVSSNKCTFIFYQREQDSDQRWSKNSEIAIDENTTKKIYDLIANQFGLDQEWDIKLFKTLFSSKINYDWIEFTKTGSSTISYAVRIEGDRNAISMGDVEESYDPIECEDRIAVSFQTEFGSDKFEFDYKKLSTGRSRGDTTIAFFNNKSFKKITELSTKMKFSRTLEFLST